MEGEWERGVGEGEENERSRGKKEREMEKKSAYVQKIAYYALVPSGVARTWVMPGPSSRSLPVERRALAMSPREARKFFSPSFFSYQDGLSWHLRALY